MPKARANLLLPLLPAYCLRRTPIRPITAFSSYFFTFIRYREILVVFFRIYVNIRMKINSKAYILDADMNVVNKELAKKWQNPKEKR